MFNVCDNNVYTNTVFDLNKIKLNLEKIIEIGKKRINEPLVVSDFLKEKILFSLYIESSRSKIISKTLNYDKVIRNLDDEIHCKIAEICTLLLNNHLSLKIKTFIKQISLKNLYYYYPLSYNFLKNYV